jgi:hypothetical protein
MPRLLFWLVAALYFVLVGMVWVLLFVGYCLFYLLRLLWVMATPDDAPDETDDDRQEFWSWRR